jgi:hypothetical protein
MTTLSLGSRALLERNPETSQRPLYTMFLGCDLLAAALRYRFLIGIDWASQKAIAS